MTAAAAEAEAEAAEALLPSKVQAMEAEGHPKWKVQAMEYEEREKIISLICTKMQQIHTESQQALSSSSCSAEREAIKARAREEQATLMRVAVRVNAGKRTPDYSGMSEAERTAEAERLRRRARDKARRLKLEGGPADACCEQELVARIIDFDPKQDGLYFNRMFYHAAGNPAFDLDDESPLGPMRFTDRVYGNDNDRPPALGDAINILSVTISSSDVGFPIQVYGSVIARDSLDHKCVYLFHRDADHCQSISSKDEPLILTGPKRGLVLLTKNYIETDLKIKDSHRQGQQQEDRELSKGIIGIRDIASRSWEECEVERGSLATRLSTVDVVYAVVKRAVEGTVAVTVPKGRFYGTITARTTSVRNKITLYDSQLVAAGGETRRGYGVIQLMRSVVSVPVRDMLIIDAQTTDGKSVCLEFTPKVSGREEGVIKLGRVTKMCVELAWSIMEP